MIKVASKRYGILPVYVSFFTWNKPVNHLPILVKGTQVPINIAIVNPTKKLYSIFSQPISVKLIVKTPDSNVLAPVIDAAKQRKKQTGMLQIRQ